MNLRWDEDITSGSLVKEHLPELYDNFEVPHKITRRERPKSAPYLKLKNIQGTTIGKIWKKIFFQKKIFDFFFEKKYFLGRTMPKNSKGGHSGSFNVFYKPKTSKKIQGGTL